MRISSTRSSDRLRAIYSTAEVFDWAAEALFRQLRYKHDCILQLSGSVLRVFCVHLEFATLLLHR